jgi:hypothetical protein
MKEEGERGMTLERSVWRKRVKKKFNYFSLFSNEQQREEIEKDDMTRKSGGGVTLLRRETMEIGGEV